MREAELNTKAVNADAKRYCVLVDISKEEMKCNYCGISVCHSHCLKSHLAGMLGDLTPCEVVPVHVKEHFKKELLEKNSHLRYDVPSLDHSNISPCKRVKCHHQSNDIEIEPINIQDVRPMEYEQSPASLIRNTSLQTTLECSEAQPDPTQKSVARIFYELGLDINSANIYNVKKTIDSILGSEQLDNNIIMPSCSLLTGELLQDEMKQMHEYVNKIKASWVNTGCSILLDGWIDENERNLVNILVECPQGPIYLRSADISPTNDNDNALESCLDEVIAEIGVDNVVQIITYLGSPNMNVVGKKLREKYPNIFWTVSASHCIELMLEKMQKIAMINNIVSKARTITKFIYHRAEVLKLMRTHTCAHNLVKYSRSKFAGYLLTSENIVKEEENLKKMFTSLEWVTSMWAFSAEGKEVGDMVTDQYFWADARIVSRVTAPLLRVLELINKKDMIMVGTIYETMDQVKEKIKDELSNRKSRYKEFWSIIDDIWTDYLHTPLHAAGYVLNPCLFFSDGFFVDEEVAGDLLCCIVRMEKFESVQDTITMQIDEYQESRGAFEEGIPSSSSCDRRTNISPAEWWTAYGRQCPELQKLAVRILSQTCNGASRYNLKRTLAEKVLARGNSWQQQKLLNDLSFVHYNLHLQNVISGSCNVDVHNDEWFAEIEGGDATKIVKLSIERNFFCN